MKAIQAAERGGYEALRLVDIPEPQPRAGQALVRVTAAGVTPLDRTVLAGMHPTARKPPLVPGNEGAGIVTAIVHGVCHTPISLPPPGDSVIGTKVRRARSGSAVSWPVRSATGSAAGSPVRCAVCRPGPGGR